MSGFTQLFTRDLTPPLLPQLPFVAKRGQRAFAEHSRPGPPQTDYDCTVKMAHRACICSLRHHARLRTALELFSVISSMAASVTPPRLPSPLSGPERELPPPRAPRTPDPVPRRALPNGRQTCLSNSQVVERGRAGDTGTSNRCTRRLISAARVSPVGRYPGPGQPVKRRHVMAAVRARSLSDNYRGVVSSLASSDPENGPRVEELRGLITRVPVGRRSGRGVSRNRVRVFCISQSIIEKPRAAQINTTLGPKLRRWHHSNRTESPAPNCNCYPLP